MVRSTGRTVVMIVAAIFAVSLIGCAREAPTATSDEAQVPVTTEIGEQPPDPTYADFELVTGSADGKLVYIGVGGEIDGVVNPEIHVPAGSTVRITLVNGDGMAHDLIVPEFDAQTAMVRSKDDTAPIEFLVDATQVGTYAYYCTVPGHRQAGQEGIFTVDEP